MSRKAIKALCEKAVRQSAGISNDVEFFSEKYKRLRELLVLCRFVEVYTSSGYKPELIYVEGDDDAQRVPDFTVFSSASASNGCDIEITEIQEPGRKRHLEYKSGHMEFDNPAPAPN